MGERVGQELEMQKTRKTVLTGGGFNQIYTRGGKGLWFKSKRMVDWVKNLRSEEE